VNEFAGRNGREVVRCFSWGRFFDDLVPRVRWQEVVMRVLALRWSGCHGGYLS
jgi:hypothetical protein